MYEESEENAAALSRLWEAFSATRRGTLVSWWKIESVAGVRRKHGGWHIINRFRKKLRQVLGVVTLAEPNTGLRFLTHEETATEIPALRQRRAYRQVNRCLRELTTVDGTVLSDHQRLVLSSQKHNLTAQRLQIGRSRRELAAWIVKTETHPVRKIPENV
jgi:hypothetical protein